MANTILQMMGNKNNPDLTQQAQQMIQSNNPAMLQAIDYVKQNGGNPKKALIKLMNERGISPEVIKSMFGISV